MNDGLTDSCVYALAFIGSNIFAGTGDGLFSWNSVIKSWFPINVGYRFLKDISVGPIAGNGANLYVGTHFGGVFHSSDKGKNWSAINNGLRTGWNGVEIFALELIGTDLFAGTSEGIYLLTNGKSWERVYPP